MRRAVVGLLPLLMAACAIAPAGPSPVSPTARVTVSPAATLHTTPSPALVPLPPNVAGIPGPGDQSVVLEPETERGAIQPGVPRQFQLGHCGLGSPIDFDGSLWNPVAGHDGRGGALTEEQVGELINPTEVTLILLAPDLAELHTPLRAVITIARLEGGRAYSLCM